MYNKKAAKLFNVILDELYPIRLGVVNEDDFDLDFLKEDLLTLLSNNIIRKETDYRDTVKTFIERIPGEKKKLDKDIEAIFRGDPAAKSKHEIILTYPGFYAIAAYRIAHLFYNLNIALIPRMITENAHSLTGIDIHPGARIGESFFIDHGTGIVIGETSEIGDNVSMYQNVTIGGLNPKDANHTAKRHPTIEDNVILYAGATVLGGETVVGKNSIVGGNVWLTTSIEPNSKVYYKPTIERK